MVIPATKLELLIFLVDVLPYRFFDGKIKRGLFDGSYLSSGNEGLIHRRVVVCVEVHDMVENGSATLTGEVEVGMVRQVHGCRLVRGGLVFDDDLIIIGEFIGHLASQVSRVSFFAVLGEIAEFQPREIFSLNGFRVPDDLIETDDSAVKVVGIIVFGQRIRLTI